LTTTPEAAVRAEQEERTGAVPAPSAAPSGPQGAPADSAVPADSAAPTDAGPPAPAPAIRGATAPAASSRVRARLARLGSQRPGGPSPVLEPLFRIVRASDPKADLRTLERAYQIAEKYHRGQRRKSGDP